jgi:hypothetical protein
MTTSQEEFEDRLRAWLEAEGRRGAPAGLLEAALHRTAAAERRSSSNWRNIFVAQRSSIAAALLAGVAISAVAVAIARPGPAVVAASPAPTPGPSAVAQVSAPPPAASPSATAPALGVRSVPITAGFTYQVDWFAAPLRFTEPSRSLNPGGAHDAVLIWHVAPTLFKLTGTSWAITFTDGDPVRADMCHPDRGDRSPTFATTKEGDAWLRGSVGMTVSTATPVTVDGRSAVRWDVRLGPMCWDATTQPPGDGLYFGAGESHRIYAIPSPAGVVLLYTWSESTDLPIAAVNRLADKIIGSLHFTP